MAIKLEIKNLYKIFGEHPHRAFKYIEKGLNKAQILEKTGLSLGVKDASLAVEKARISNHGALRLGEIHHGSPSQSPD